MAQSSTCRSSCQNPLFDGKDKLIGGLPTKVSNCCTLAPAVPRAPTSAVIPVVALLAAFSSADFSVVRYLEKSLYQIVRTIFEARSLPPPTLTFVLAPIVIAASHNEGSRERPLKARFPDIYQGKTHLECYDFFQLCKNNFATAGTTGQNQVLFAAIFLKDTALFCWRQHQCKIEDQTNVFISWKGFKAFFCQSLGKSKAFVDTI